MAKVTYKYHLVIRFNNGKSFEIYTNDFTVQHGPKMSYTFLRVNGQAIASVKNPAGQVFENEEVHYYTSFPKEAIYQLTPSEWNLEEPGFKNITNITVTSRGRTVEEGD